MASKASSLTKICIVAGSSFAQVSSSRKGRAMLGMILDDEPAVCEHIGSVLQELAVEYEVFYDPVEALKAADGKTYGFVFVDIDLPHMDGLSFARHFKERAPTADVVFITGHGDYEKAVEAIRIGAYDFIKKPFKRLDINMCMHRLLEKRRLFHSQKRMEVLKFANEVALALAHELRNPLTVIGGFAKRIVAKKNPPEKLQQYAKTIFEESVKLEKGVSEILAQLRAGTALEESEEVGEEDAEH